MCGNHYLNSLYFPENPISGFGGIWPNVFTRIVMGKMLPGSMNIKIQFCDKIASAVVVLLYSCCIIAYTTLPLPPSLHSSPCSTASIRRTMALPDPSPQITLLLAAYLNPDWTVTLTTLGDERRIGGDVLCLHKL